MNKEFKILERLLKRIESMLSLVQTRQDAWLDEKKDDTELKEIRKNLEEVKKEIDTFTKFQQNLGPLSDTYESVDYQHPIFAKIEDLKKRVNQARNKLEKKILPPPKEKPKKEEPPKPETKQEKKQHERRFKRFKKRDQWKKL